MVRSDDLIQMYDFSLQETLGLIRDQHDEVRRKGSQIKVRKKSPALPVWYMDFADRSLQDTAPFRRIFRQRLSLRRD